MMTSMTAMDMFVFFILALGCEGARVEIHPSYLRVSDRPTNITVTCRSSSAPITGCQFSWWSRDGHTNRAGRVLDLNKGAQSVADPVIMLGKYGYGSRPLLGYSYSGRGLSSGDCGLRMEVGEYKVWLISCRVKTSDTWVYDWMNLYANSWDPLPHTLEPREVVVVQGRQARILLKTQGGLNSCYFNLPVEGGLDFDQGPSSSNSTGRHLYKGAGLSAGECGLSLSNITEEDNGLVRSYAHKSSPSSRDSRLTPLIVALPPTPPVLTVSGSGNNMTATCRVESSRPAPNITWFLGDKVILHDDSPGTKDESWRWPWMGGSWSQTIAISIQPEDSGKELKCSLAHVILTRPLEAAEVVQHTDVKMMAELAKSKAQHEMEEAKSKAQHEVEEAKTKAEAARTIAQHEVEAAKSKAEAAKSKAEAAKLEVEAARTRTMIAEEELEFMQELHRRQLNNIQPQINCRTGG